MKKKIALLLLALIIASTTVPVGTSYAAVNGDTQSIEQASDSSVNETESSDRADFDSEVMTNNEESTSNDIHNETSSASEKNPEESVDGETDTNSAIQTTDNDRQENIEPVETYATQNAATYIVPDGYYEIRSAVSGKNLEVYGISHAGGAKITQWYSTGGKNQKWKLENLSDGTVRLTNVESGLVLDLNASNMEYEQWDWHGGANQRWQISKAATDGNYYIRNVQNGHAVDVLFGNMNDGQYVVDYEYNGGVNQQWQFIATDPNTTNVIPNGYYEIRSAVSGKNLEVYGVSHAGGAKITQWYSTGGRNQKWQLENLSDGTVRLTNVESGLVLDLNGGNIEYEQWDWHGRANQRWQISKAATDGNYYIRNGLNGHAMDVLFGNMNDGQYVVDYEYNGGVNQQWQFIATDPYATQVISDGYYEIRSAVSGKNLAVQAGSHTGGEKIIQSTATGGKNQKWKLENLSDGIVRLINVESGLVMALDGSNKEYEQWEWNGRADQRWQFSKAVTGNYYIRSAQNGHAIDVLGNMNDGQPVVDYEYNGGMNQQWQLVPTTVQVQPETTPIIADGYYEIRSAVSGKNLEVYGVSHQGGAKITQWSATGGNNQKWRLENLEDGTVRLTNVESGLVMDLNRSNMEYEQWDWHGEANQRWQITKAPTKGYYYIQSAYNTHAVDLLYGNMNDGQHVADIAFNGGINQQWQFIPTIVSSITSSLGTYFQNCQTTTLTALVPYHANNRYKFSIDYNGRHIVLQNYSNSSTCRWTPIDTGTYTVNLSVIDSTGKVFQTSQNIEVISNGQNTLTGIDVSQWQGNIDWGAVKNSGVVNYAMLRVGYGREPSQKDPYFERNYAGATSQNIPVGVYHYSYANTVTDAIREADACLQMLNGKELTLPIAYDIEDTKTLVGVNKQTLTDIAIAFCDRIKAAGYQPMIYTNPSYANDRLDLAQLRAKGYDVWIANYGVSNYKFPYPVKMWQYSSTGRVPGISDNVVDMNYWYVGSDYSGNTPLPAGQKGQCNDYAVNIRANPSTSASILYMAQKGYTFTILESNGVWYRISFGGGREGWIHRDYVQLI